MNWANIYAAGAQTSLVSDLFRSISWTLDSIIYKLIPLVYDAIKYLYDISALIDSSEVLSTAKKSIYSLLAIFMFFKLAFSLLGMLVDPSMIENKEKGAGKLVSSVMVCLMLIVAVPYVFQYAKMAQSKIMEDQIIEKAIYGSKFNSGGNYSLGDRLSLSAWSVFFQPTVDSGLAVDAYNSIFEQTEKDATAWKWLSMYTTLNLTTGLPVFSTILKLMPGINGLLNMFNSGIHYQISYIVFFTTILGVWLLWSMLKMCIDVAYRSLKLLALELLSPVAIISYVDPKSSKDGVFAKWLKECVKTYTSLFVRIFVFAFVSLLLSEIDITNVANTTFTPFIRLIYILAIIAFIKTAPKFIDGIFGTELSKESETKAATNLLKGLGFGLATMGMGAIKGGVVAKRTDGKVFKGAMKGGWQGLMSGFESGNKNGFNMRGVVGAFTNTWSGINKEHGYEYNRDEAMKKEKMKDYVRGVNQAKKRSSFGWDRDDEAAARKDALDHIPAGMTDPTEINKYANGKVKEAQLANAAAKHEEYLKFLREERRTKGGYAFNYEYLAGSSEAEELWAKSKAIIGQETQLASVGVSDQSYLQRVKHSTKASLEAKFAEMIKADVDDTKRRLLEVSFAEKANVIEQSLGDTKVVDELTKGGITIPAGPAKGFSADDTDRIYEAIIERNIREKSKSKMTGVDKDGHVYESEFDGFDSQQWGTAKANTATDAEGAKQAVETYKETVDGKRVVKDIELFNKAKNERDAEIDNKEM